MDKPGALGMVSVFDIEEVGAEVLATELTIDARGDSPARWSRSRRPCEGSGRAAAEGQGREGTPHARAGEPDGCPPRRAAGHSRPAKRRRMRSWVAAAAAAAVRAGTHRSLGGTAGGQHPRLVTVFSQLPFQAAGAASHTRLGPFRPIRSEHWPASGFHKLRRNLALSPRRSSPSAAMRASRKRSSRDTCQRSRSVLRCRSRSGSATPTRVAAPPSSRRRTWTSRRSRPRSPLPRRRRQATIPRLLPRQTPRSRHLHQRSQPLPLLSRLLSQHRSPSHQPPRPSL
jgi:hypothetical protein